jgi:hypothetical protein|tara:strand:- start:265 stop:720 length:456 start_codon:yes stop_codon:yes gene_type:complete
MAAVGRPTGYTEDIADKICSLIAMGLSLNFICGADADEKNEFPHRATVYRWFSKHPEFCDNYARAKDDSADADADKVAAVCEDVLQGKVDPQSARVAIDALKWMAGKKRPKKYGDRITQDVNLKDHTQLSDDELARKLAESRQKNKQSLTH